MLRKKRNHILGNFGESIAQDHLIEKGMIVLKKRYKSLYGEIDLICLDSDTIVFAEVKQRTLTDPSKSNFFNIIHPSQINRIKKTSLLFLKENPDYSKFQMRFDIVIIYLPHFRLEHIKNIYFNADTD